MCVSLVLCVCVCAFVSVYSCVCAIVCLLQVVLMWSLSFQPLHGVWIKEINDAVCVTINPKYRLISFGRQKWVLMHSYVCSILTCTYAEWFLYVHVKCVRVLCVWWVICVWNVVRVCIDCIGSSLCVQAVLSVLSVHLVCICVYFLSVQTWAFLCVLCMHSVWCLCVFNCMYSSWYNLSTCMWPVHVYSCEILIFVEPQLCLSTNQVLFSAICCT